MWIVRLGDLFVLVEGDPNVDFVHGLPEYEGTQCHCEVWRQFHHLFVSSSSTSVVVLLSLPIGSSYRSINQTPSEGRIGTLKSDGLKKSNYLVKWMPITCDAPLLLLFFFSGRWQVRPSLWVGFERSGLTHLETHCLFSEVNNDVREFINKYINKKEKF